ncbi:MAG: metallopeptidase TldD-related protein [Microlunatus sp.]|nr:metallopeptidase TldD-related protein [Microlunatus sp.]MDN5769903.1 metallopeptidase TldD-related protein [Microlunatus sp.]
MSDAEFPHSAELVEQALAVANGPTVAYATEQSETNLRWAGSALTTNGEMSSTELTVVATAAVDGGVGVGTVSQQLVDASQVADLVTLAETAAKSSPPSPDAASLVEASEPRPYEEFQIPAERTSIEVLAQLARDLGMAFADSAGRNQRLYGFAEHSVATTYLGTSTGVRRRGVQPTGRLELNAKSTDGSRSAWAGAASRNFADVDVSSLVADLATRLGWAERRVDLPPGRYETILPPGAVADLMIYAWWTANARDAEEGQNAYAAPAGDTKIGTTMSDLPLRLCSDPGYPGLECVPFVDFGQAPDGTSFSFDLGLPIDRTDWMVDGVWHELIRNRAWAEHTGRQATPPADNLILDGGGRASLAQMVADTERGLLLTCLWYIREVDPERLLLTGLTRDGVYLVEDGEVTGAVNNFRFNESPLELLGRITEVGATEKVLCREWNDFVNRTAMPPIRVPDFNMSTVSQAS